MAWGSKCSKCNKWQEILFGFAGNFVCLPCKRKMQEEFAKNENHVFIMTPDKKVVKINKNMQNIFNTCVDDDNVEILDWIHSHFQNGNWHKNFEVTVTMREIDWDEDGNIHYVKDDENDI